MQAHRQHGEEAMSRVIIADEAMRSKLGNHDEPVTICDADGKVIGYFTPALPPQTLNLQPQISEEEIQRRIADTTSPRYTTTEVLRRIRGN
jgi:hypothetical protein